MLVTTPVTILKTYDYSETSKILRCLTRDLGLRSVIAKGARRPRSRFGGLVEPFSDGIATFYLKDGRDLYTLSSFELTRERQALGRDLVRFGGAGLLTELALRFSSASDERRLFDRLRTGLDRLVAAPGDPAALALREAWGMISALGFRPAVARCVSCSREPNDAEEARFDLEAGGL
ncbi:MAG: DNA repair protein RecO, partial [Gemmatimonadota bacterium]